MSRILSVLCALLTALTTLTIATPAAHAVDGGDLRVLITGDSFTHGRHGDFTWRYRLDKELQRQGASVDLVGSTSTPYVDPGYATAKYADPNFDSDHFAKAGWALRNMVEQGFVAEVTKQQPDVIVLEIGINDFLRGYSVASTLDFLRGWVAAVRAAKPDVRIMLTEVLAVDRPTQPYVNERSPVYNDALPGIVSELSTTESPITIADTSRGWSTELVYDGIHPTPAGEIHLAQRVGEAFHDIGVLAENPAMFATAAWTLAVRPDVTVAGRRATVTWDRQGSFGGRVRMRQIGAAWPAPRTNNVGNAVFAVTPGLTYEWQVQLVRGTLTGPWGAVTRAKVPPVRPLAPARVTVTKKLVRWPASVGATSYVVRMRRAPGTKWIVRRTKARVVNIANIRVAQVRAVNAAGTSAWRRGVR